MRLDVTIVTFKYSAAGHTLISIRLISDIMPEKFLIVLYDSSNSPSRIRVKLWRKLRNLGGIYPNLSLCLIPYRKEVERDVEEILLDSEINKAIIMISKPLKRKYAKELFEIFRESRNREYLELLEECEEFLREIRENIEKGNVSEEEAEELENALESLEKWFEEIKAKDYWNTRARKRVESKLRECRLRLQSFITETLNRKIRRHQCCDEDQANEEKLGISLP